MAENAPPPTAQTTLSTPPAPEDAEKPNIFFIIGAPTSKTFEKFKEFIVKKNVKLVICADMPTYINALKGANVFKTPTNFRAHADDVRTFYIGNNETITTDSVENFKKLQEDIATSLYDIFKLAHDEKIPTYFGIVKRENRPTWLNKTKWVSVEDDDELTAEFEERKKSGEGHMKTWFEYKNGPRIIQDPDSVQNASTETFVCEYSPPYKANYFDKKLTEKIRDDLLIPKVYGDGDKKKGEEKLHEIINNPKISKYGATFLSDMITVACAGLIDNDNKDLWQSYEPIFGKQKTIDAIYSGNRYSKFGEGIHDIIGIRTCVKQENLNFKLNTEGTFFGYKETGDTIKKLTIKMHAMIGEDVKMFNNCYVWHDDELNDLDDLPAIGLIEKLSKGVVTSDINYNKLDELKKKLLPVKGGRRRSKSTKKKRTKKKRTKKKNKKNTKKRRSRKNKKRRR